MTDAATAWFDTLKMLVLPQIYPHAKVQFCDVLKTPMQLKTS